MPDPTLWLSFLEDAGGGLAPHLRTGPRPDAEQLALTDRARWVLGAISLPRELAPETASDERQRARLGSRLWSSGEITARIPYQHRSTIRLALADLRSRLGERGLALEDYLLIDTARGRYAVRGDNLRVDVVELHEIRHDPAAVDRHLDAMVGDRRQARLAPVCAHLLGEGTLRELQDAIGASAARAAAHAPSAEPAAAGDAVSAAQAARRPTAGPRRRTGLVRALVVVAVVAAASALVPVLASGGHRRIHALGPPRGEVSGGVAHTWSNPHLAGGRAGREIMAGQRVLIACRLRGFKVADGNVWWYLIASPPWSRRYYVTADSFYNDGRTSGSLRGSAFVDPRVARCS